MLLLQYWWIFWFSLYVSLQSHILIEVLFVQIHVCMHVYKCPRAVTPCDCEYHMKSISLSHQHVNNTSVNDNWCKNCVFIWMFFTKTDGESGLLTITSTGTFPTTAVIKIYCSYRTSKHIGRRGKVALYNCRDQSFDCGVSNLVMHSYMCVWGKPVRFVIFMWVGTCVDSLNVPSTVSSWLSCSFTWSAHKPKNVSWSPLPAGL